MQKYICLLSTILKSMRINERIELNSLFFRLFAPVLKNLTIFSPLFRIFFWVWMNKKWIKYCHEFRSFMRRYWVRNWDAVSLMLKKKQELMTFRILDSWYDEQPYFEIWSDLTLVTRVLVNHNWTSDSTIESLYQNFRTSVDFFGLHLAALLQTLRYRKCETVFYNYLYNYLLIQLFIYTIIYTKLVQLMTFWKMSLMSSAFQSLRLRFFRLGQWWLNICFEYREGTFRTVLITYQWNK